MNQGRRWYDSDADTAKFVTMIQVFPAEIQSVICNALVKLAEIEFKADELIKNYRSLGAERIMSLYASKNKRRNYDNNPSTHTIMNYIQMVNPENKEFIVAKANEVIEVTSEYFSLCKQFQQSPTLQTLSDLTETQLKEGGPQARELLKKVQTLFVEKTTPPKPSTQQTQENKKPAPPIQYAPDDALSTEISDGKIRSL